jgi:four helix bundle protein
VRVERNGANAASPHGMPNAAFAELRRRAFAFSLDVVRFCRTLPSTWEARRMGEQLFRCGTSVGANYFAADQRRSSADFVAKMGIVIEETDECRFWLALLKYSGIADGLGRANLAQEARELLLIFAASLATARRNAAFRRAERSPRTRAPSR